jgi:tryptophan synthase alpha chain
MAGRIERRFAALASVHRTGFIPFITAGDPDLETSAKILAGLAGAGADFIELGMPFSDPMADGPTIQAASLRALKAGTTVKKILEMVREFRKTDSETPIILMGYYNPIYVYGSEAFVTDARAAGVDGLIIVDIPPEADDELCLPAAKAGLDFIRLLAPTTDDFRLPTVLKNTGGFLYYISITGTTGTKSASPDSIKAALTRIRRRSNLPIAAGFGVKTPAQVREVAKVADAVVVGSAIVKTLAESLDAGGQARAETPKTVLGFVSELATGVKKGKQ